MSDEIKFSGFDALYEHVVLENFDELTRDQPQQNRTSIKSGYKKAVLVKPAPPIKKAVKLSDAPKKGPRFTNRKIHKGSHTVHFTNAKNAFKRAQKAKSRKGTKRVKYE